MFGLQRQERLLDELRRHGAVRVRDLAELLGVSELTVRRDIAQLAERNLLTRVHGGATLPTQLAAPPPRRRPTENRFTVGMVVPSLDYYWPPVVTGARAAASALGVHIQLRGSSYDPEEDRRQIGRLIEAQQVEGLLLAPHLDGSGAAELIDWIDSLPVPTILVERHTPRWTATRRPLDQVRTDHSLGVEMAVHHLYEHGHRRIGLLLSAGSPHSDQLAVGWSQACADLGISDAVSFRASVGLEVPGHREIIAGVMRRCRSARTTALIVHSDPDAVSVGQFCAEQGVLIPDDLALISYDDELAHLIEPPMTAVRPPKGQVGRVAVELMVARLLEGNRRPAQRVLISPELVIRGSSVPRAGCAP
jgi:DNA-binding LacI/PurR family transcriptional regulator